MSITPTLALKWLESNSHNRPVAYETVKVYARDMAMGDWTITHQGIAFDYNDRLIDGQHRLWAIVESKTTVIMQVTFGLHPDTQLAVDGGRVRSARDVISLRDAKPGDEKKDAVTLSGEHVGVARLIAIQLGNKRPSRNEQIRVFDKYATQIRSAIDMFPRRVAKLQNALTICVVTRALVNDEDREAVSRFVTLLIEGQLPAGTHHERRDSVPILLRNAILERAQKVRSDIYKKTQRALRAFLDNDPIKTLYSSDIELFPLPEEGKNYREKDLKGLSKSQRRARGATVPYSSPTNKANSDKGTAARVAATKTRFNNPPRLITKSATAEGRA